MDQESLAQIQEIIGAATDSLRADIAEARRDTGVLRQELQLVTASLRADIADARHQTEVLSDGLRQELRADIAEARRDTGVLREELQVVAESLRSDIADARRHAGVLNEELRHEVQLLAEGFEMHLSRRHAEECAHLDEQFRETRALVQLSYSQIQERVERLEQRVRHSYPHDPPHAETCAWPKRVTSNPNPKIICPSPQWGEGKTANGGYFPSMLTPLP